ncbi:MAG TPA: hypothetical protein VGE74_18145 [Gemmata sp.]
MAVYFVYRCHYGAPNEKHLRRFEYETVLEWAQAIWKAFDNDDTAYEYARGLLGGLSVYSFGSLFHDPTRGGPVARCPETMEDVCAWFGAMYDPTIESGPHHLQVATDDDEIDMAVLIFDDHYRAANPGKADFLLLPDWELPGGESDGPAPDLSVIRTDPVEPHGTGHGTLYVVREEAGADNLQDKNACDRAGRVEGVRVPDLARHLLCTPDLEEQVYALREVRDFLTEQLADPTGDDAGFLVAIRDQPGERTHWDAYTDWLEERGLPPAGLHLLERALRNRGFSYQGANRNPAFDRVKVTPHMAQACKHEDRWHEEMTDEITPRDMFVQFIFFDDRWAAAHPALAAGILTFASRWDVLT